MTRDAISYSDQLNMITYSESSEYFSSSKHQDDWRDRSNFWDIHLKSLPRASCFRHISVPDPQAISYQHFEHSLFLSTAAERLSLQWRQKAGSPEFHGHSTVPWIANGSTADTFKPFRRTAGSCSKNAIWLLKAHIAVSKAPSALKQHKLISNQ